MIRIANHGCGLTFEDWIDALLQVPEGSEVGNPFLDIDDQHKEYWLRYLIAYRQQPKDMGPITHVIKESRGIGAWYNPEYVVVTEKLAIPMRLGGKDHGSAQGHPYWDVLPRYQRLRPFMESKKALKFFFLLPGLSPHNTWVTVREKVWTPSWRHSFDLFLSELKELDRENKVKKIILLGDSFGLEGMCPATAEIGVIPPIRNTVSKVINVAYPTFCTTTHTWEWEEFRARFALALKG